MIHESVGEISHERASVGKRGLAPGAVDP
jgi:hypothetical protein